MLVMTMVVAVLGSVGLAGLGPFAGEAAAAPPIIVAKRKFDHDRHASAAARGGKDAACTDCHRYDAQGAMKKGKEHGRCASCHTQIDTTTSCNVLKAPGPKGIARVCEVCHVAKRRECLPDDLPPPPKAASFAARFTHGRHLALGTSIEKDCVQCHRAQAAGDPPKVASHTLCSGCHNPNGAKPVMADCRSCHVVNSGPTARQTQAADPYRLAGFDHRAHHASSRQASCLGCHDRMAGAGEAALPRPSMLGCQNRCHDGKQAFSAVGTTCTQCHTGRGKLVPTRPEFAFSHAAHASRNVKIADCATCHTLEPDGRLTAPLMRKDHQPCASSGCHQTEFASRTTKICAVCHDAVAPWQKVAARARPAAKPEWFESINHAAHLAKTGTANGACTSCHGEKLTGGARPGGHDGCASCHNKGVSPAMTECAACHASSPAARPPVSPWSVAATFKHDQHATDPRTRKTTACLDCHAQVRTATTLATIKPPTMTDCDSACHNGTTAFKTTGFGCARCHASPKAAAPVPTAMLEPATR
ncbi:MAG: hypothetical protein M3680_09765 [Myxococcota bacterium]|nr:hypothetical protein [Myxococcota bacterium]